MRRKIILIALTFVSVLTLALGLTACKSGKSAYDMYVDAYLQVNGTLDGVLGIDEWLLSLKGEQGLQGVQGEDGEEGLSAYEIYQKYTNDNPVLTEEEWLESLKGSNGERGDAGETGKSAYDLYVEAYKKENASLEGVLSESEWLKFLKGDTGIGIKEVNIICGDIIICYDNDHVAILEDVYPEAGHKWDSGNITSKATCITPGIITFTCEGCEATKKEISDANGEHKWSEYNYNEEFHWQICRICGDVEKHEHDFGDNISKDDVDAILECECGINQTVGNFFAYKVVFECGVGASVLIYETQDYSGEGTASTVAYSRDDITGSLLNNGEGQVNFEVVVGLGYKIKSITASPKNYKNLKDPSETDRDNTYRITKITGELTVSVQTEIDFLELPVMVINTENSAPILDKEKYVNCSVSVLNAEDKYCFSDFGAGIRGRGNYTWTEDKKPYKIKFDSKIDLFGNGKAKKWTLIANHYDFSLIRNYLTFLIGANFDSLSDTTTSVQFVDLYLNGEYEGVYLICEQNEVGKTRVDIEDDFSVATTPEEMGFLLELDGRAPDEGVEDLDYIRVNGQCYAIKSPDYEDIEDETIDYSSYVSFIKNYLENICDALKNKADFSVVQQLIDIDSFADSYILNELVKSGDIGRLSFFIYRNNEDGKLYCGPVWDYDVAIGNCIWADCAYYNVLYAKRENFYYRTLLEYDEFVDMVAQKLSANYETIRNIIFDGISGVYYNYSNSFLRNFERWDVLINGTNASHTEELTAIKTWEGQVEYVKEWLLNSLDYMMSVYCPQDDNYIN